MFSLITVTDVPGLRARSAPGTAMIVCFFGLLGAMFPWESAFTGSEVCPGEIYSDYEQHISGDIAFAVKQYWWATQDRGWLNNDAAPLIYATAEFWAGRAVYNSTLDAYVIYDVMPPDEDAEVVNNSVYTNVVAKMNLEFACEVLPKVGSLKKSC